MYSTIDIIMELLQSFKESTQFLFEATLNA